MPAERSERRRRQDPVSCENCRAKKLRCDRQQPCANCTSRHWTCHYKCEKPPPAARLCDDRDPQAENSLVQARLDRLEKAVFGKGWLDLVAAGTVPKDSPRASTPEQRLQQDTDLEATQMLENACLGMRDAWPNISDRAQIVQRTLEQLVVESDHLIRTIQLIMPLQELALRFLDIYETFLDSAQHVMHVPSVREQINISYARSWQTKSTASGVGMIALTLAICADVGHWDAHRGYIFSNPEVAIKTSTVLAKYALEAVDHARRSCFVSLEIVQAHVLLCFLFYHLEGFSSRTRELHSSALSLARDLELHKIDDPRSKRDESCLTREDLMQLEISRKLWWHITSTDWLLAFVGGPHEGVYSSHPQHMSVNMPRNLNNDDLLLQGPTFSRPDSEPTTATYFLVRVKLACLCREAVDLLYTAPPEVVQYEAVMELDDKFVSIIQNLPREIQLDVPWDVIKQEMGDRYNPQLALQRAMANLMAYTRRCKLHLPYLVRVGRNPRYSFSRQKALESARRVMMTRRVFLEETSGTLAAYLRLGGIMHHVFYAAMILVMDVCLNAHHTHEELLEVREALQIVEDAEKGDRRASRFLESLSEMMKRHQVKLPATSTSTSRMSGTPLHSDAVLPRQPQVIPIQSMPDIAMPVSNIDQLFGVSDFEDVWQDFMGDAPYLDPQSWDALVNDLEMRLI